MRFDEKSRTFIPKALALTFVVTAVGSGLIYWNYAAPTRTTEKFSIGFGDSKRTVHTELTCPNGTNPQISRLSSAEIDFACTYPDGFQNARKFTLTNTAQVPPDSIAIDLRSVDLFGNPVKEYEENYRQTSSK